MADLGKPRIFKSGEEFENKVNEYIEYCILNERFVNIAGFCRFAGTHRQRFYEQKQYYPDSFLRVQELLEDESLNNTTQATPITILYLKNKFGYRDKIETENTNVNTNKNMNLDHLSVDDLKKLIDDED